LYCRQAELARFPAGVGVNCLLELRTLSLTIAEPCIGEQSSVDLRPLANLSSLRALELHWQHYSGTPRQYAVPEALRLLADLTDIHISGVMAVDLDMFCGMPHLTTLALSKCGMLVLPFRGNEQLRLPSVLHLKLTSIPTAYAAAFFSFPSLQQLTVTESCEYINNVLAHLKHVSSLTVLNCDWSFTLVAAALTRLPNLRSLHVFKLASGWTCEGFADWLEHPSFKQLVEVSLPWCTRCARDSGPVRVCALDAFVEKQRRAA
jgi:hypothetical protein